MTKTLLPQQYCADITDHPAHTGGTLERTGPKTWDVEYQLFRCPGRYTPRLHRAPDPQPRPAEDPFAGIPGAANDEETW